MYKLICNNLKNYANDFNENINDPRYKPVSFLHLIENPASYQNHKNINSDDYLKLTSFLWAIKDDERSEQILFELKVLGIEAEAPADDSYDFTETKRIWQMFLKKAYWR